MSPAASSFLGTSDVTSCLRHRAQRKRCKPSVAPSRTHDITGSKKTRHNAGLAVISHASLDQFLIRPRFDTARTECTRTGVGTAKP
ncbi:hypothetical protein NDU88_001792 [Pleurodeles waltl]|uniref:Uncharacterized protein n=1 Tax=Pleurodeles waltl TaxID=8319 RepID=A0AAV7RDU6_PLEWA|nr:hypothetical protein NDU88_001792 [Pleurodeles waltl]